MQEPTGRALIQVADNGENSIGKYGYLLIASDPADRKHQSCFPVQIIANVTRNGLMMFLTITTFLVPHMYCYKMKYTQDPPVTLWSMHGAQLSF